MNDRPLHDDTHQDEPLAPVWRRWPLKKQAEEDEPTGHTETILELIKRVSALEARVMLLESLNKQPYFDSLISKTDASDPIYASPTIEG